jgi:hypothetical protein
MWRLAACLNNAHEVSFRDTGLSIDSPSSFANQSTDVCAQSPPLSLLVQAYHSWQYTCTTGRLVRFRLQMNASRKRWGNEEIEPMSTTLSETPFSQAGRHSFIQLSSLRSPPSSTGLTTHPVTSFLKPRPLTSGFSSPILGPESSGILYSGLRLMCHHCRHGDGSRR